MKLKASEIALLIAAVVVVGLVVYNFLNIGIQNSNATTADETEAVIETASEFSEDPETLRQQMRNADDEKVKRYMRKVIDKKLPENYDTPQYIVEAGTIEKSVEAIGERFPEFYKKGGNNLINAVRQYPVKYVTMIEHTRAYREMYRYQLDEKKDNADNQPAKRPATAR